MKTDIFEVTRKLNLARMEAGKRVFKNHFEFKSYLKKYGLKVGCDLLASTLYATACKNGQFLPYPIYVEKVKTVYEKVANKSKQYYEKSKNNKADKAEEEMLEATIELLKSKGYKIFKPIYEEI